MQGLGHRISFGDSFILNAFGDAACALTPLRIGGEPARLAGMLRSRVPATAAFVAISLEVLAAWPVIIVAAGWLAWRYAPAWWKLAGPRLGSAAEAAWPWVRGGGRREHHRLESGAPGRLAGSNTSAARSAARSSTGGGCRAGRSSRAFRCRFVNLATRVAILPVLALTLPNPPAMGPLTVGLVRAALQPARAADAFGGGRRGAGFPGRRRGRAGAEPGLAAVRLADVHQRDRRDPGRGARARESTGGRPCGS